MTNYLTVGSCFKNEESYALDFVRYHRSVGVERFIFLDRTAETLKAIFADDPDVEVLHFPETPGRQHADAWVMLIARCAWRTQWLACIDADQALVPQASNSVPEILRGYEDFGCVRVNWHTFGAGGALVRELGSVYERFTRRAEALHPINNHTQFIVQPHRALAVKPPTPHEAMMPEGEVSVNTSRQNVCGPFSIPPVHDVLWCAHYISKSREEWDAKNAKGRCDIYNVKMPHQLWNEHETFCSAVDEQRVKELWRNGY